MSSEENLLFKIIGQNVKYYRKSAKKKMTQEQLAEKADISTSLVGKIESTNIHQGISIYTLWKISNALGVPIELFFVPPKSEK